jgi:hypothetical protein
MLIGIRQRLKSFGSLELSIDDHILEREDSYKYLGVIINETLYWADHIDYVRTKLAKRLGIFKRIKHLLPFHARLLVVNSLILPLLDYDDLVWGDKNNVSLMNDLQILHNKTAKSVLDLPIDASSSQALTMLKWYPLSYRRQFHRCSFVYKALNNNVDFNMEEIKGSDLHCHDTRKKQLVRLPLCRTN